MARTRLLFYVTGHGFGHAARITALLGALRERAGDRLELLVRSDAPPWIFQDRDPAVRCAHAALDIGVRQPNGLDLDLPGTLAAHQELLAAWDAHVAREAEAIRALSPAAVVADIPALAFEAAAAAGVPAVGIANFSWDWILEPYAEKEPGFEPVLARMRRAYALARELFRLPFHGDFPAFSRVTDAPLLVRRSQRPPERTRAALGLDPRDARPLVLVSFGGFGHAAREGAEREDLSGFRFVGFGEPPPGLRAEWIPLPHRSPIAHEDLVAASDVVIGKPGYGTVAEVIAHGTRFLYVPRENFREMPVLEAALAREAAARPLARADFEAGRWRRALEALLERSPPAPTRRLDGAEVLAETILARYSA